MFGSTSCFSFNGHLKLTISSSSPPPSSSCITTPTQGVAPALQESKVATLIITPAPTQFKIFVGKAGFEPIASNIPRGSSVYWMWDTEAQGACVCVCVYVCIYVFMLLCCRNGGKNPKTKKVRRSGKAYLVWIHILTLHRTRCRSLPRGWSAHAAGDQAAGPIASY